MRKTTKVLFVLLRIAIGWHFLYEGVFKIQSDSAGTQNLTSRYFLQASTARLRDFFATPPEGVNAAAVDARVDKWNDDVLAHFKGQSNELSREQQKELAAVADEIKRRAHDMLRRDSGDLAAAAPLDWVNLHEQILKIADKPDDHFTSLEYLQGSTGPLRGLFRALVPDIEGVERMTKESAQARIDRRYDELVAHYGTFTMEQKAKLALARDDVKRSVAATLDDPGFQARIADYKYMQEREREYAAAARQAFSKERRDAYRKRLDMVAGELLAFVNEPLVELTRQAQTIATIDQMKAGPAPRPREQTWFIDWMVKWGLVAMGLCLIAGLFSQVVALAAAVQLAMFFFAAPPLPGLPATTMGGHFLYVDRNLIELIAALLVASVPSGKWAGLDAWLGFYVWPRLRRKREEPAAELAAN